MSITDSKFLQKIKETRKYNNSKAFLTDYGDPKIWQEINRTLHILDSGYLSIENHITSSLKTIGHGEMPPEELFTIFSEVLEYVKMAIDTDEIVKGTHGHIYPILLEYIFSEFNNSSNKEINTWLQRHKDYFNNGANPLKDSPPRPLVRQKTEQETPKTFEELFYNPADAEPCLKILNELHPPAIDAMNNYIGKAKGIFPLWVKVLKNHKPKPLMKPFKDIIYKDLLNSKVKGLNLSKDASEFRKSYKRIDNNNIELDIKTILSQYSQSGKLGK